MRPSGQGAGRRRNVKQREYDLVLLAKWVAQRRTIPEIQALMQAERGYSMTKGQISYDRSDLMRRWRESANVNMSQVVAAELAELEEVSREAWDGWHKSKTDKVRNIGRKKTRAGDGGEETTREIVSEGQSGNPSFLLAILNAQSRRAALLGLDMPTVADMKGPNGEALLPQAGESVVVVLPEKDFIDIQSTTVEGNGNGNGTNPPQLGG